MHSEKQMQEIALSKLSFWRWTTQGHSKWVF